MNLPISLSSPDGVAATKYYRDVFRSFLSNIGDASGQTWGASATQTRLAASLGAIDAGLVNLLAYHCACNLEFDRDACLRMIGYRLDKLNAKMAAEMGGVQ